MKIKNGDICPGKSVADLTLGMSYQQVCKMFSDNCPIDSSYSVKVIKLDNAKLWFDKNDTLYQIGVEGDFRGKYKNAIGLGSTLKDVKNLVGNYVNVYDTYEMEVDKGICFELEDIDEWDELEAPIDHIYVFRVKAE